MRKALGKPKAAKWPSWAALGRLGFSQAFFTDSGLHHKPSPASGAEQATIPRNATSSGLRGRFGRRGEGHRRRFDLRPLDRESAPQPVADRDLVEVVARDR